MNDTDRQKLLSAAFHEVETIVGGHAMRPLSLASYDVLLRTGNPLVKGEMPEEGTPEFTSAIMGFVFAHCAPWPEVVRASFDEQAFRESALIFCGGLGPGRFSDRVQAPGGTEPGTGGGTGGSHGGTSAEKSRSLRRTRLPSRPGVRRRRRNRLARGADPVHAAGPTGPVPALPVAEEWGADELEPFANQHTPVAGATGGIAPSLASPLRR